VGQRGGSRVRSTWNFLPVPVGAMHNELAVFESPRTPISWPIVAGVTPTGANKNWPIGVRTRPVSEIGWRRNIPVRTNV